MILFLNNFYIYNKNLKLKNLKLKNTKKKTELYFKKLVKEEYSKLILENKKVIEKLKYYIHSDYDIDEAINFTAEKLNIDYNTVKSIFDKYEDKITYGSKYRK